MQLQNKVILVACCVLVVNLPVLYFTDLMFLYNEKRIIVSVLLIMAGVLTFFTSGKNVQKIASLLPVYFIWGVIISFLFIIISLFQTEHPFYGIVEISLYVLLLWVVFITADVVNTNYYGRYVVIASACVMIFFYSLKFGLGYSFYLSGFKDFPLWPADGLKTGIIGFANIRFFNQVQIFTLPLLLGGSLLVLRRQKLAGYFLLFLSVFWWMSLIESAGRGIILSALTAALATLYFLKKYTHRWTWYFLGTLLIGYLANILLFDIIPPDTGSATKSILRGGSPRMTMWPQTFLASLGKPIFGHGPMSFSNVNTGFTPSHPHNSVLQLLYEYGYPVTITFVAGIYYGLKKWINQTKEQFEVIKKDFEQKVVIRISLTVASVGGLIYSFFSGVIVMPLSQLWLALISGTMLGLYFKNDSKVENAEPIKLYKVVGVKLTLLLASITLASVLIKDIPHLRENEKRFVEKTDRHVLRPRFWQQGKIGLDEFPQRKPKTINESNL